MKASKARPPAVPLIARDKHAVDIAPARRRQGAPRVDAPAARVGPIALVVAFCVSACTGMPPSGPYARTVLDRPLPANETQQRQECDWIRNEMGWQHDVSTQRAIFADGRDAVLNRVTYERNLMVLEARAKVARCNE
jgi:hypothetical protein